METVVSIMMETVVCTKNMNNKNIDIQLYITKILIENREKRRKKRKENNPLIES